MEIAERTPTPATRLGGWHCFNPCRPQSPMPQTPCCLARPALSTPNPQPHEQTQYHRRPACQTIGSGSCRTPIRRIKPGNRHRLPTVLCIPWFRHHAHACEVQAGQRVWDERPRRRHCVRAREVQGVSWRYAGFPATFRPHMDRCQRTQQRDRTSSRLPPATTLHFPTLRSGSGIYTRCG
jgi:hypothetical protein